MEERFNEWNIKKQKLNNNDKFKSIYFKQGDIWWSSIGQNIGSESYGKGQDFRRPVLILKKLSSELFIGVPLSSKEKNGTWFVPITFQGENRIALIYQIRTLHSKRLTLKMGQLDDTDFNLVKEKLEDLLELSNRHPNKSGIDGIYPKSTLIISDEESLSNKNSNIC
jgi:mRNA interferase MazF